ncbi:MAG: IPT/TIG domain-containing protein [Tidjanibacter sp.]|nr:IPT/TIG domain-containing protein [Tidjanibacter sp.]
MKNKFFRYVILLAAAMTSVACNEVLNVDDDVMEAPIVESFEPTSGPVGTIVTVKGQYLNNVNKAYINDVEVPLYERVSDTQLSFTVSAEASTGKVKLANAYGSFTTEAVFTFTYAVPELIGSALAESAEMGGLLLISGKNLNAVQEVLFTAEGYAGHSAAIRSRNNTEILVKVPYVEGSIAKITFTYNNGEQTTATDMATAPSIAIVRYVPTVTTTTFERTAVGSAVQLEGVNLDKVEKITVGGFEAVIGNRTETSLQFAVPAGEFVDGDNVTNVKIHYFDGNESKTLTENFIAFVPMVKYWEGMKVYGQGRDVEEMASFFSPETGRVYHNSAWRTEVDPISYKYLANTCSAANVPAVTEEEYNSVNPYFFFSGVSAGHLQLNGPANSTGQLKNFYFQNNSANDYRCPGVNGNVYGTPVLRYRYLNPANATEKALIDKVVNKQIDVINEELFPIDVEAKTIAGIGITSASGGLQNKDWYPQYEPAKAYTSGVVATITDDIVFMVMYYNHNGSPSSSNYAENIKRVGFLHITKINVRLYNNSVAPSSSDFTFNCYWQKYDYDYTKL